MPSDAANERVSLFRIGKSDRPSVRPSPQIGANVYDVLLERLISRQIEPDDRVSVDALVREFGVSQTPIRGALSQLEAQGLVVKTHLSGYRAAPPFTTKEFEDLYSFRRILEPKIAADAARNVSPELKGSFERNAAEAEALQRKRGPNRFNVFARTDIDFHFLVANASDNRFFQSTVLGWTLQFHLFRRGYNPQWLAAVVEEHGSIQRAIVAGDLEEAERTMRIHLDRSYARYRETTL